MGLFKTESWKSTIDPTFDEVVKTYVSLIRKQKEYVGDGHFGVKDEYSVHLNGLDHQNSYLNNENVANNTFEALSSIGMAEVSIFFDLEGNIKRNPELFLNSLRSMSKTFPKESRKYYHDKINAIQSGSFMISVDGLSEEDKKKVIKMNTNELSSLLCSLLCRYFFVRFQSTFKEDSIEFDDFIKKPGALGFFLSLIYNLFAQLSHQRTISELLAEGDDNSLLKAITTDKSLLYSDAVKDRFMKAHISGDFSFIKKVGTAISRKPLNKDAQHYETYLVLKLFWKAGLSKLKRQDLYNFLVSCDLIPPNYPHGFERFLGTYIIPLYKD